MDLSSYRRKRNFNETAEPVGLDRRAKPAPRTALAYVIQKHDSKRPHYDLRLEWNGVLKSWAVPKGPSLDPAVKALAVQTEDHPLEYATFEGVIPEGQYGAGSVVAWDRGRWTPVSDPDVGLKEGHLRFKLHGRKLKGEWRLVRISADGQKGSWLLIKSSDRFARRGADRPILAVRSKEPLVGTRTANTADGGRHESVSDPTQGLCPVVRLTHPDRVLLEDGTTKADLARYYESVADWMLPHLRERPIMLLRRPGGPGSKLFVQKHPSAAVPASLHRIHIRESEGAGTYMFASDVQGLMAAAQISAVEIHSWGSRVAELERPDRIVFDLDPGPGVAWPDIISAAQEVRETLRGLGLVSFVKTSGGKGLHVLVPIGPRANWEEAKAFAKSVTDVIALRSPARYTARLAKEQRRGRVLIDYLRNVRGATCVEVLSPRAKPGTPVSMPLSWEELSRVSGPGEFTIKSVPSRLKRRDDLWPDYFTVRQYLTTEELKAAEHDAGHDCDQRTGQKRVRL